MAFLQKANSYGVKNIQMEATVFASFTKQLGIRAAVCCVTLLDRLDGDQHPHSSEELSEWDERPGDLIINFILQETSK